MVSRSYFVRTALPAIAICVMHLGAPQAPAAVAPPLDRAAAAAPSPSLRFEYHPLCRQPLQYIGFSFDEGYEQLIAMKGAGANAVSAAQMWIPFRDPDAPYGCGAGLADGTGRLSQTFTLNAPFAGVAPVMPTWASTGSGCSWRLYRQLPGGGEDLVAEGRWRNLVDNGAAEAKFPRQPPGSYRFEVSEAVGSKVGWWLRLTDVIPGGHAIVNDRPREEADFEFNILTAGARPAWHPLVPRDDPRKPEPLGPNGVDRLEGLGMFYAYGLGTWNNPSFPYYPDWFIDRFPETIAVDQYDKPLEFGVYDTPRPSPNIESGVIVNGATRFIELNARACTDNSHLLYYVLGGEALYATYGWWDRWFDYSHNALTHFRNWLLAVRYPDLAALNTAWGRSHADIEFVSPPRAPDVSRPWLDWMDFRFESMAERYAWHWQAAQRGDPARLAMSCNHGRLYRDLRYAAMGARPELYASATDGFETGQIMVDDDSELFNLLYINSLVGLGKPYCPVRLAYRRTDPNARGGGTSFTPQAARRYGWETLGSGAWHMGFIQWSGTFPDGEWGVAGTPAEAAMRQFHTQIHALSPLLQDLHAVRPAVGVFISHPTWALLGWQPEWQRLHHACAERQIPMHFVYDEQVVAGGAEDYAAIVVPGAPLVEPRVAAALASYAARGGRLLIAGEFMTDTGPWPDQALEPEARGTLDRAPRFAGSEQVIAALLADGAIASRVRPVRVSTDDVARRVYSEEILARPFGDLPLDLTTVPSAGQTVTAAHDGLSTIALGMPTWANDPPVGFDYEVRREDPSGALLARGKVGGGIRDNSLVAFGLDGAPVKSGDVLYVQVTASPGLPALHLGWWTNTLEDVYAGGRAWVDGAPADGDRRFQLQYDQYYPAEESIEAFHLSDGVAHGFVLVNTGDTAVDLTLDFSPPAERTAALDYHATCPTDADAWREAPDGAGGRLRLGASDGTMIYLQPRNATAIARRWLPEARARVEAWHDAGALTSFARYTADRMEDAARAGHTAKVLGCAVRLRKQLGLALESPGELGRAGGVPATEQVVVRVVDGAGMPVADAEVRAEVTPSSAGFAPLRAVGNGRYRIALAELLPPLYDYERQVYRPFSGPLRLRIAARSEGLSASEIYSFTVGAQTTGGGLADR